MWGFFPLWVMFVCSIPLVLWNYPPQFWPEGFGAVSEMTYTVCVFTGTPATVPSGQAISQGHSSVLLHPASFCAFRQSTYQLHI